MVLYVGKMFSLMGIIKFYWVDPNSIEITTLGRQETWIIVCECKSYSSNNVSEIIYGLEVLLDNLTLELVQRPWISLGQQQWNESTTHL